MSTSSIYSLSLHDALPISFSKKFVKYVYMGYSCITRTKKKPTLKVSRTLLLGVGSFLFKWRANVLDRKSTRLNSSHVAISYAVFCLKKKKNFLSICDIILV